jgi:hypothetical protein
VCNRLMLAKLDCELAFFVLKLDNEDLRYMVIG